MRTRDARRAKTRAKRRLLSRRAEAAMEILRTADFLRRRFAAILEPHGLTGQQYNVLRILRGARPDPLPTMEIAARMIEKTPAITGLIDRLVAKGLVERRQGADDRRCVLCSITPAGLDLLAELDAPIGEADEAALAAISEEDADGLTDLLAAVRKAES